MYLEAAVLVATKPLLVTQTQHVIIARTNIDHEHGAMMLPKKLVILQSSDSSAGPQSRSKKRLQQGKLEYFEKKRRLCGTNNPQTLLSTICGFDTTLRSVVRRRCCCKHGSDQRGQSSFHAIIELKV